MSSLLRSLAQDLRFAARGARKQPGFTTLAVLALALGTGATTTIFSVIQNVLLDPFPYRDSDRVVSLQIQDLRSAGPSGRRSGFELPEFLDYQAQVQVFEDVIGGAYEDVLYTTPERTQQFAGGLMTGNAFAFLGVPASVGRTLTPDDARPGAAPVFVMTHKMWVKHFNSDPNIVGRNFVLNGVATRLVGIMPARFTKLASDLYKPLVLDRTDPKSRGRYLMLQARLKPGVTLAQAESHVAVVAQQIAKAYLRLYPENFAVKVVSWVDSVIGEFRKTLYTLASAVGLLLLIACSNVANLLLSRAASREKEMAVRAALGARRGRLIQQLLVESFLLALLGGVVGCGLAHFGLMAVVHAIPEGLIPREAVIRLNLPVLAFSLGVTALTPILFGLVPALRTARADLVNPLGDASKGGSGAGRGGRLSAALVIAEVALSLVLMASAGLLMRSFFKLQAVDLGLNPENVLATRVPLPRGQYQSADAKQVLFRQMLDRVQALPGVVAAATTTSLPPYGGFRSEIDVSGKTHDQRWDASFQLVSEGYFSTLGIHLLRGRLLSEGEIKDKRKVAVINRTMSERYFGGDDPIGKYLTLRMLATLPEDKVDHPVFEIVGVVADAKNQGIKDPVMPEAFIPHSVTGAFQRGLLIRTVASPLAMLESVRREIWSIDRNIALSQTDSLTNFLKASSYAEPRFFFVVLGIFAAVGLVLVAIGVYSVIAYTVSRQAHDIGIRMALGATGGNVLRMVLRRGLALVGGGTAVGLLASLAVTRLLSEQLYGVRPHDTATLAAVIAVVVVAGLSACYFPARRATRVNPMVAIRRF